MNDGEQTLLIIRLNFEKIQKGTGRVLGEDEFPTLAVRTTEPTVPIVVKIVRKSVWFCGGEGETQGVIAVGLGVGWFIHFSDCMFLYLHTSSCEI